MGFFYSSRLLNTIWFHEPRKHGKLGKKVLIGINDRYASVVEEIQYNIAKLEKEIREQALLIEETINGATLQAVYAQGKVSWDDKGLTGFAVAYPKILSFKKQGEPYITIRTIKK